MAEAARIKGTDRAAILLMTLGEQTAASVLKHMDVEEVHKLGVAMAGLSDVPRERVTEVLGQLLVAVQGKTPIGIGTNDYLRRVMTDSLGERRAGAVLGRIMKGRESTGIDALKWMEGRGMLKGANPLKDHVAAVSCGIVAGNPVIDLDYVEDSGAQTDANFVITGAGGLVEVQGTAEGAPFSEDELLALLKLAKDGVGKLVALQKAAVA